MKPLTLDELAEEVRQGRTPPFSAWSLARDYERSLFPPDTHWPVEGEVYECVSACEVTFVTHWHTAFTGGGATQLLIGEHVRVGEVVEHKPVIVSAVPVDYLGVLSRIIPAADREHPKFAGYSVSLRTRELVSHFRIRIG
jgi:hypothetical protein